MDRNIEKLAMDIQISAHPLRLHYMNEKRQMHAIHGILWGKWRRFFSTLKNAVFILIA
jgi:hypothetical protein